GLDARAAQDAQLSLDERRFERRVGRVVSAAWLDLDVAEPALREMRFEERERPFVGHVRHEPQVELRDGTVRLDRLATRAGVAGDEALDVHGRPEEKFLERLAPRHAVRPALRGEK